MTAKNKLFCLTFAVSRSKPRVFYLLLLKGVSDVLPHGEQSRSECLGRDDLIVMRLDEEEQNPRRQGDVPPLRNGNN